MNITIRPYRPSDERSWLRCSVLAFLETAYFDSVFREKPRYEYPTVELVADRAGEIVGLIDVVNGLDGTLAALADPTRRQLVELLRERPRRAGELAAAFETSGPAVSKHLRVLRASGLVEEERDQQDARVRLYRLRAEPFDELQSWLQEVQRFWTDQLNAFKAHAEQTRQGGTT